MQQDELLQSQAEAAKGMERYTQFHDFAPLGYLTLSRNGTIIEVNLTGAKIIGLERSLLNGDRFGRFVLEEDLPVFNKRDPWYCEVRLMHDQPSQPVFEQSPLSSTVTGPRRTIRMEAVLSEDTRECRIVLSDITIHKQIEQTIRRLLLKSGTRSRLRTVIRAFTSKCLRAQGMSASKRGFRHADLKPSTGSPRKGVIPLTCTQSFYPGSFPKEIRISEKSYSPGNAIPSSPSTGSSRRRISEFSQRTTMPVQDFRKPLSLPSALKQHETGNTFYR